MSTSEPEPTPGAAGQPDEAAYLSELSKTPAAQIVAEMISTLVPVAYLRLGAVPEHPEAADTRTGQVRANHSCVE